MTEIDPTRVTLTFENHVAHVRLNRADKRNAMDDAMIHAVIAAGEAVAASDARACVIAGEGAAFCAGIDLGSIGAFIGTDPRELLEPRTHGDGTTNRWQEFGLVWTRVPIPVIAALHGSVFGAGLQLALGADIRIAGPETKLALMETKWGIVPDMGAMIRMPRLVPDDVLRLMTYTANPIDAQQALAWGLVTQCVENPLEKATELAEQIAGKSPNAIRAAKRLINMSMSDATEAEILMAESRAQAALFGTPEQMEAVAAGLAKRPAKF